MAARKSLHRLTVTHPVSGKALQLPFTDVNECDSAYYALCDKGFKVERFIGAKLYRTADEAVEDARFWLGDLPKAA